MQIKRKHHFTILSNPSMLSADPSTVPLPTLDDNVNVYRRYHENNGTFQILYDKMMDEENVLLTKCNTLRGKFILDATYLEDVCLTVDRWDGSRVTSIVEHFQKNLVPICKVNAKSFAPLFGDYVNDVLENLRRHLEEESWAFDSKFTPMILFIIDVIVYTAFYWCQ